MRMTARDWLLLWVLSVLWGGAFFFAAVAVKEVPPLTLVLCRVGIAALILFVFILCEILCQPAALQSYISVAVV